MLEGDGLASQQTCSLLGAGSALETLTCVQSHSMSDPKKYPSKPGVADCKSDLTIHHCSRPMPHTPMQTVLVGLRDVHVEGNSVWTYVNRFIDLEHVTVTDIVEPSLFTAGNAAAREDLKNKQIRVHKAVAELPDFSHSATLIIIDSVGVNILDTVDAVAERGASHIYMDNPAHHSVLDLQSVKQLLNGRHNSIPVSIGYPGTFSDHVVKVRRACSRRDNTAVVLLTLRNRIKYCHHLSYPSLLCRPLNWTADTHALSVTLISNTSTAGRLLMPTPWIQKGRYCMP